MEFDKIQLLLAKYLQGESNSEEETYLRSYFSSENVDHRVEHYKPLFDYYAAAKKIKITQDIPSLPIIKTKKVTKNWTSIAASVAVLLGTGTYAFLEYNNSNNPADLGTYDDPEIAFRETQKALAMLSNHVNTGIVGIQYIQEFEKSKNKIFNPLIKTQ